MTKDLQTELLGKRKLFEAIQLDGSIKIKRWYEL